MPIARATPDRGRRSRPFRRDTPCVDPVAADDEPIPAAKRTVGQAWKHKRNIMICIAYGAGCSQRFIADVFDLPHSRVHAIIVEYRAKFGSGPPAA